MNEALPPLDSEMPLGCCVQSQQGGLARTLSSLQGNRLIDLDFLPPGLLHWVPSALMNPLPLQLLALTIHSAQMTPMSLLDNLRDNKMLKKAGWGAPDVYVAPLILHNLANLDLFYSPVRAGPAMGSSLVPSAPSSALWWSPLWGLGRPRSIAAWSHSAGERGGKNGPQTTWKRTTARERKKTGLVIPHPLYRTSNFSFLKSAVFSTLRVVGVCCSQF